MALPLREPAPIRPGDPDPKSRHRSIERELRPVLGARAGDLADVVLELDTLIAETRREEPSLSGAVVLAGQCRVVALWAHAAEAPLAAVTFAQAAWELDRVRGSPDPHLAYDVGRFAAALEGLAGPAADWFAFAALHARRLRRYDLLSLSLRELAALFAAGGDPVSAQRVRTLASRADRRGPDPSAPELHLFP